MTHRMSPVIAVAIVLTAVGGVAMDVAPAFAIDCTSPSNRGRTEITATVSAGTTVVAAQDCHSMNVVDELQALDTDYGTLVSAMLGDESDSEIDEVSLTKVEWIPGIGLVDVNRG